jgi:hypothetical protein
MALIQIELEYNMRFVFNITVIYSGQPVITNVKQTKNSLTVHVRHTTERTNKYIYTYGSNIVSYRLRFELNRWR